MKWMILVLSQDIQIVYGLIGSDANSIQPGNKRMLSSMTPSIST